MFMEHIILNMHMYSTSRAIQHPEPRQQQITIVHPTTYHHNTCISTNYMPTVNHLSPTSSQNSVPSIGSIRVNFHYYTIKFMCGQSNEGSTCFEFYHALCKCHWCAFASPLRDQGPHENPTRPAPRRMRSVVDRARGRIVRGAV